MDKTFCSGSCQTPAGVCDGEYCTNQECVCGAFKHLGPNQAVGGGSDRGTGDFHSTEKCENFDSSLPLAKFLWAIGDFFLWLGKKVPQRERPLVTTVRRA